MNDVNDNKIVDEDSEPTTIQIRTTKGKRDRWKAKAERGGVTLTELINRSVDGVVITTRADEVALGMLVKQGALCNFTTKTLHTNNKHILEHLRSISTNQTNAEIIEKLDKIIELTERNLSVEDSIKNAFSSLETTARKILKGGADDS